MAEKRKVVLTQLAAEHIHSIYTFLQSRGAEAEAEALMDDFLDMVFGEIPRDPEAFPICGLVKSRSQSYRMAKIGEVYRVVFQFFRKKVRILLILHEDELPSN